METLIIVVGGLIGGGLIGVSANCIFSGIVNLYVGIFGGIVLFLVGVFLGIFGGLEVEIKQ